MASASASSFSLRSRGVVCPQVVNASAAAATAASTSPASLDGTSVITSPVAGSSTSSVAPVPAGFQAPPMKFSCAIAVSPIASRYGGLRCAEHPQGGGRWQGIPLQAYEQTSGSVAEWWSHPRFCTPHDVTRATDGCGGCIGEDMR